MKRTFSLVLAILMVLSLAACGSGPNKESSSSEGSDGVVEIHIGNAADVTDFSPWSGYNDFKVFYQLYDQLVTIDENGEVLPDLAESWTVNEDGTEYTFKLREDVTFTNGDKMTAEDVAYSINTAVNSASISALTTAWKSAEVVDEYTVKICLDYGYNFFLQMLSTSAGSVCNKDVVEAANKDFSGGLPGAGTGAFVVDEYVSGSHLTYAANENYYKGASEIKKVVFEFISEASTAAISLQSGALDYTDNINFADIEKLEETDGLELIKQDELRTVYMFCNLSEGNANSPIANPKVREAISYAVNREDLKDYVYEGYGCTMSSFNYPTWPGYDDEPKIERDVEYAKQLMSEAGYPNGCELTLVYDTEYLMTFPDAAVLLQSQLADIGITLKINPLNKSALTDAALAGTYGDLMMHANGCFNDPFSFYDYMMSSKAIGSTNHSFWSSETVDALLVKGRTSSSDEEVAAVLDQLREELWKEWPVIPLCSSGLRCAAYNGEKLTGCRVDFDFNYEIYDWQLVK